MKIKDLLEGNVTNIADARSKRAMDRDAEAMREIDQMLAADPEVFAIPKFEGKATPPTRKDFPRKIAVAVMQAAIPDQFKAQLDVCEFHVQRRMCDGTRVMDIGANIKVKGFVQKEIYDAHPLEAKLFRVAVMALVEQMGTMVNQGQFTGAKSATIVLN